MFLCSPCHKEGIEAEVTAGGTTYYLWGLRLVAGIKGNDTEYYHHDGHGNVTAVTDENGNTMKTYEYDAFGVELNEDAGDANPFRYCGAYYDKETGLYYLINRYYDPTLGRFTQRDPAKDGGNWYIYCYNDPVQYKDLTGMIAVGDDKFSDEIQIILNGTNKNGSGGLTLAWELAYARNDDAAMKRIANEAQEIRKFSVTNINRIVPLLNTTGAYGAGHTATLLINENEQGLLLSYWSENNTPAGPGEMRIAALSSKEWQAVLYGTKAKVDDDIKDKVYFAASNGTERTETYNGSFLLYISNDDGYNALKKVAELYNAPGKYNVTTHNCDHQTASIMLAANQFYDKHILPNDSFLYTRMYYTNYSRWLLSQMR